MADSNTLNQNTVEWYIVYIVNCLIKINILSLHILMLHIQCIDKYHLYIGFNSWSIV